MTDADTMRAFHPNPQFAQFRIGPRFDLGAQGAHERLQPKRHMVLLPPGRGIAMLAQAGTDLADVRATDPKTLRDLRQCQVPTSEHPITQILCVCLPPTPSHDPLRPKPDSLESHIAPVSEGPARFRSGLFRSRYDARGVRVGPSPLTTPGLANYDTQHPYPNNGNAPDMWVNPAKALHIEPGGTGPAVYQVGGTLTADVLRSSGDTGVFNLTGSWGSGMHNVQIRFINDAWGGTTTTDRNLFVSSIAYDGTIYADTSAKLFANDAWGGVAGEDRNLYINGIDINGQHVGSGVTAMFNNGTTNFTITTTA